VQKIATSIEHMTQLKLSAIQVRRLEGFNIHNTLTCKELQLHPGTLNLSQFESKFVENM
jgi:hypothetical protein